MKGLSYRLGSVGVGRTTEDSVVLVDTGTIYVTNKRLIFDGARTNTSIRLNKILSFTPYSNGVEIDKAPVNRCRPAGV
jgi:hypothetical protein